MHLLRRRSADRRQAVRALRQSVGALVCRQVKLAADPTSAPQLTQQQQLLPQAATVPPHRTIQNVAVRALGHRLCRVAESKGKHQTHGRCHTACIRAGWETRVAAPAVATPSTAAPPQPKPPPQLQLLLPPQLLRFPGQRAAHTRLMPFWRELGSPWVYQTLTQGSWLPFPT